MVPLQSIITVFHVVFAEHFYVVKTALQESLMNIAEGGKGKLLALVAKTFCIYICANAVMNNQQNVATLTTAKNYWPVLIPS